jgi:hypothetical protein
MTSVCDDDVDEFAAQLKNGITSDDLAKLGKARHGGGAIISRFSLPFRVLSNHTTSRRTPGFY